MKTASSFLVASMNPSIDVTMEVETFQPGGTNRAVSLREDAGGKGINVARALKAQGVNQVICGGLLWKQGSEILLEALAQSDVMRDFVTLPGSVRRNIKVFDRQKGEITEINARSQPVAPENLEEVRKAILRASREVGWLVLTGSLPTGCSPDFYARLMEGSGIPCALDADGEALLRGVRARPRVLKCNEKELALLGETGNVAEQAKKLIDRGTGVVLASMGAAGSVFADERGAWRALPLKLAVRSTVGAGDAMLSGYLAATARGEAPLDAFRQAVASASASVEGEGTCAPGAADVARYLNRVKMERVMEW